MCIVYLVIFAANCPSLSFVRWCSLTLLHLTWALEEEVGLGADPGMVDIVFGCRDTTKAS